ncbi:hypothetical protein L6452_26866 [Arctium lappa]|uniref:Uncharacterized protein n=1 Tax=Arctium lappa TaxID=4217 RepID=A0ACB8ZWD8_ARCLA|nr:hypothetical protein L6452_26866 [Arctium lappa]
MPNTNRHRSYDTHHHHSPPKRHPKLFSIFLKFIVMFLILSLFLLFLGLAAIILLHVLLVGSFVRRRHRRHRHRHSRNITPPPTSSYSFLDLQTHLPSFQYSAAAATFSGDCSICLENFKESELCRSLPECDHVFHTHCVDSWLTKVANCPVCRRRVRLETGRPSDRIDGDDDCKFLWVIGVGRQIGVNY